MYKPEMHLNLTLKETTLKKIRLNTSKNLLFISEHRTVFKITKQRCWLQFCQGKGPIL